MALGNNRDYKTTDRRARKALARHKEIMDRLISEGVEYLAASAEALRIMENRACSECGSTATHAPDCGKKPKEGTQDGKRLYMLGCSELEHFLELAFREKENN